MIEVRQATQTDWPKISAFVSRNYEGYSKFKHRERFEWQLQTDPFSGPLQTVNSWLALSGQTVVGQISAQPGRIHLGQTELDIHWIVDVMVDKDWRQKGIAQQLYTALYETGATLVTLTMALATRRMAERLDCVTLGPVSQLLLPYRVSHRSLNFAIRERIIVRKKLAWLAKFSGSVAKLLFPFTWSLTKIYSYIKVPATRHSPQVDILRQVHVDEESWTQAWLSLKAAMANKSDRSWQFYNWRYEQVPDLRYGFSVARKNQVVAGVAVWRRPLADELNIGTIVDVVANPGDVETVTALVNDALDILSQSCESVVAGTSNEQLLAVMKKAGFLVVKNHRPTVVCKSRDIRKLFESNAKTICFSKADHDWDQVHAAP